MDFRSDAPNDPAGCFVERSNSFGLACVGFGAAAELKAGTVFGVDASVPSVFAMPKPNAEADSFGNNSTTGALNSPLLWLSPVLALVVPNVKPPE